MAESGTAQATGLKQADLVRLARILGLLGSDNAGERANAALAAHRLVRRCGVDWWTLLGGGWPKRISGTPSRARIDPWSDFLRAARARERQLQSENEELRRQVAKLRMKSSVGTAG